MLTIEKQNQLQEQERIPHVDLCFPVIGKTLPADNGYGLYSALSHWKNELHQLSGWSLQSINGIPDKQGKIYLGDRSFFRLRLPSSQIPLFYGLAGRSLKVGIHEIKLGIPQIYLLKPATKLRARIVVIKGYEEAGTFLEALQRQLHHLDIEGVIVTSQLMNQESRKTIKIKRFKVVGFSVEIEDLSTEDSLILQINGLGGKRKMGCGVFIPTNNKE